MNCWLEKAEYYASVTPEAKMLTACGKSLTYKELVSLSKGFAVYLSRFVGIGDCIVCRASQTLEYFIAYCATLYCGGVFVPLENDCPISRICDIATQTQAKSIIGKREDLIGGIAFVAEDDIMRLCNNVVTELPPMRSDREAQLLFTSGSTGKEKGSVSCNSMLVQGVSFGDYLRYDEHTSCYIFAPVNHVAFFMMSTAVFCHGGEVILSQGLTNVGDFVSALANGVNAVHATPSAYNFLLLRCKELLKAYEDQIEIVSLAGEKCSVQTQIKGTQALPKSRQYIFYGSTETAHMTHYPYSEEPIEENCVGYPSEDVEMIMLPHDEGFRIACKTPFAMKKYFDGKEISDIVVTDDIGYIKNGKVYVTGRVGDIIISGGHKIDPYEVENVAKEYAVVEESVCIAVDDAVLGHVLKLFVKFRGETDCNGLIKHLYDRLEQYKVPRTIVAVDNIEKTDSGKINRKFYKES